eukprot:12419693-Karenia_brevis.AAC.1
MIGSSFHLENSLHLLMVDAKGSNLFQREQHCNASENEEARRRRHRNAAIKGVKKHVDYVNMLVFESTGELDEKNRPATPDANDLTVTKRSWEKQVQAWRKQIKIAISQVDVGSGSSTSTAAGSSLN